MTVIPDMTGDRDHVHVIMITYAFCWFLQDTNVKTIPLNNSLATLGTCMLDKKLTLRLWFIVEGRNGKFKFYCHLVGWCFMDNHAMSPIFIIKALQAWQELHVCACTSCPANCANIASTCRNY